MAYKGIEIPIPMGQQGLRTDDAATKLPPTVLIDAQNVTIYNNLIEKERGSATYNASPLTGAVVGIHDWHPTTSLQRLIAVTGDGKIYRDTGDKTFNSNTAITSGLGSPTANSTKLVEGGNETAANAKKLFILTGTSQIQVLEGDGTTTADISNPASDWASSNYPTNGILHRNRLFVWRDDEHRIYASDDDDHEVFDTGDILTFNIFPGEGDGIKAAITYKGRLYIFKGPKGVYYLEDSDSNTANWYFKKASSSFGAASPHAAIQVIDDLLIGNSSGTITSLQAVEAFGDLKQGDIISNAQIEQYLRDKVSPAGFASMQATYYEEKKIAYFTYRDNPQSAQNRMLEIDLARREIVRYTFSSKDQVTCLEQRRDTNGILRPLYGNDAGFILELDNDNKNVGGAAYEGVFQTPHMDFSFVDSKLANKNKLFDFLTLVYQPTGTWSVDVEVYIDDIRKETIQFSQSKGRGLDDFILDVDTLGGTSPEDLRKPLHGCGRRISFRISNVNANEDFRIEQLIVAFRVSDERQTALTEGSS